MVRGDAGSFFQFGHGMFFGQMQQALHDAQALRAASLMHSFSPGARQRPDHPAAIQQVIGAAFDEVAFAAVQVSGIGGELPRFGQRVQGDLFPARVVKPQQPGFLPHPDFASDVFGWRGVIRFLELHIAVAMHRAPRFFKHREQARRQRLQRGSFHCLEQLAHLPARSAVNARIGHVLFPIRQVSVLRAQAGERPPLDRVVLRILDG
jgi:hypothetical protein